MKRALIDSDNSTLRNILGGFSLLIIVPFSMLAAIIVLPFSRPIKLSANEVSCYLRDFIEGKGGAYDFDDFISVQIADPQLDNIRKQAALIELPVTEQGLDVLKKLLSKSEALATVSEVTSIK